MRKGHGTIYREEGEGLFLPLSFPSLSKGGIDLSSNRRKCGPPSLPFPDQNKLLFPFFCKRISSTGHKKAKKGTRRGIEKLLCRQRKFELIFVFSRKMSDMIFATSPYLPLPFKRKKILSNWFFPGSLNRLLFIPRWEKAIIDRS